MPLAELHDSMRCRQDCFGFISFDTTKVLVVRFSVFIFQVPFTRPQCFFSASCWNRLLMLSDVLFSLSVLRRLARKSCTKDADGLK